MADPHINMQNASNTLLYKELNPFELFSRSWIAERFQAWIKTDNKTFIKDGIFVAVVYIPRLEAPSSNSIRTLSDELIIHQETLLIIKGIEYLSIILDNSVL